jgi:hypothetical protein
MIYMYTMYTVCSRDYSFPMVLNQGTTLPWDNVIVRQDNKSRSDLTFYGIYRTKNTIVFHVVLYELWSSIEHEYMIYHE